MNPNNKIIALCLKLSVFTKQHSCAHHCYPYAILKHPERYDGLFSAKWCVIFPLYSYFRLPKPTDKQSLSRRAREVIKVRGKNKKLLTELSVVRLYRIQEFRALARFFPPIQTLHHFHFSFFSTKSHSSRFQPRRPVGCQALENGYLSKDDIGQIWESCWCQSGSTRSVVDLYFKIFISHYLNWTNTAQTVSPSFPTMVRNVILFSYLHE